MGWLLGGIVNFPISAVDYVTSDLSDFGGHRPRLWSHCTHLAGIIRLITQPFPGVHERKQLQVYVVYVSKDLTKRQSPSCGSQAAKPDCNI